MIRKGILAPSPAGKPEGAGKPAPSVPYIVVELNSGPQQTGGEGRVAPLFAPKG